MCTGVAYRSWTHCCRHCSASSSHGNPVIRLAGNQTWTSLYLTPRCSCVFVLLGLERLNGSQIESTESCLGRSLSFHSCVGKLQPMLISVSLQKPSRKAPKKPKNSFLASGPEISPIFPPTFFGFFFNFHPHLRNKQTLTMYLFSPISPTIFHPALLMNEWILDMSSDFICVKGEILTQSISAGLDVSGNSHNLLLPWALVLQWDGCKIQLDLKGSAGQHFKTISKALGSAYRIPFDSFWKSNQWKSTKCHPGTPQCETKNPGNLFYGVVEEEQRTLQKHCNPKLKTHVPLSEQTWEQLPLKWYKVMWKMSKCFTMLEINQNPKLEKASEGIYVVPMQTKCMVCRTQLGAKLSQITEDQRRKQLGRRD